MLVQKRALTSTPRMYQFNSNAQRVHTVTSYWLLEIRMLSTQKYHRIKVAIIGRNHREGTDPEKFKTMGR